MAPRVGWSVDELAGQFLGAHVAHMQLDTSMHGWLHLTHTCPALPPRSKPTAPRAHCSEWPAPRPTWPPLLRPCPWPSLLQPTPRACPWSRLGWHLLVMQCLPGLPRHPLRQISSGAQERHRRSQPPPGRPLSWGSHPTGKLLQGCLCLASQRQCSWGLLTTGTSRGRPTLARCTCRTSGREIRPWAETLGTLPHFQSA